ncbi:MAG TPA: efflux RND transporter periplasmic adaptor subunit [Phycisphaerae bacterium]|nr:efflux RND transporter periplasmic adaptor subunit [Phycisphaerae bacterium]HRY70921.1 efflux RND transporter periplasmic adaptor subunit [Phycisphaerae bacterium]
MLTAGLYVRIALLGFLVGGLPRLGCNSQQPPPAGPMALPEVAVFRVSSEPVPLSTELPGRTSPYLEAEVRPQVSGIIQSRRFDEGADVRAGDVLYQIDPAPYQAAYDRAKAALAVAEANVPAVRARAERYQSALASRAVSQQDCDEATAALEQAKATVALRKAEVESARIDLSYTPVSAPISGRIGKSNITVGALVTAHQPAPLATIHQLDPIYVDVKQSFAELLRLKRSVEAGKLSAGGDNQRQVHLLLDDGSPYPREGMLQFRDVKVDPSTGSFSLRIVFPNPDRLLLPGMYVRAIIQTGVAEHAILVPQQGVSRSPKGEAVALIVGSDNQVQQRMITVDREIGDKCLVSSGLAPGDELIVEGIQKVRPGALVKKVPFENGRKQGTPPGTPSQPAGQSN